MKPYRGAFPKLTDDNHVETSGFDPTYNCIGHAAESRLWWEPAAILGGNLYWPPNAPKERSVEAYAKAYESVGYARCADGVFQDGFKKVAIFALNGTPQHAARQVGPDQWTSKLGKSEDITHRLEDLTGPFYGSVALFLRKPV